VGPARPLLGPRHWAANAINFVNQHLLCEENRGQAGCLLPRSRSRVRGAPGGVSPSV